jgi:hypothetical protein
MSVRIVDRDRGFAALVARIKAASGAITVGVHQDAPAAPYAAMNEFHGELGLRAFADSAPIDPIRREVRGAVTGTSVNVERAGKEMAEQLRAVAPVDSGDLRASIEARRAK